MESVIKRRSFLTDELLILCRENPGLIIPEKLEKRLDIVIKKLFKREGFTSKEWESIKPLIPESEEISKNRIKNYTKENWRGKK